MDVTTKQIVADLSPALDLLAKEGRLSELVFDSLMKGIVYEPKPERSDVLYKSAPVQFAATVDRALVKQFETASDEFIGHARGEVEDLVQKFVEAVQHCDYSVEACRERYTTTDEVADALTARRK